MNDLRAPILILADDCWLSFFTVPVFKSSILPLYANTDWIMRRPCANSSILTKGSHIFKVMWNQPLSEYLMSVYALYLYCYSLQKRAAPWAFLCHLGGADHKGRSQAIQTVIGWGQVSGSQRHKQYGLSRMKPRTGSRQLPPIWDASVPVDRWHAKPSGWMTYSEA